MMSIFQVRDRRKERRRKEGKWKEVHLQCDEYFEFPLAKPKTTKENIGMGNNLTILGQTAVFIARFCTVPQTKFDVFRQSKREEEKWISNKFRSFNTKLCRFKQIFSWSILNDSNNKPPGKLCLVEKFFY